MTIKDLLIEADAIQVGVMESDWRKVIELAASPRWRTGISLRVIVKRLLIILSIMELITYSKRDCHSPCQTGVRGEAKLLQSGGIR